jgi:hypothetical protein
MGSDAEARDGHGRWTSGGGAAEANTSDTGTVSPGKGPLNPGLTHEARVSRTSAAVLGLHGKGDEADVSGITHAGYDNGAVVVHGTPDQFYIAHQMLDDYATGNAGDVTSGQAKGASRDAAALGKPTRRR